jgi:hypothetical protein
MKMVSVVRKLSTIEERRQDQSYLFLRGDYRNKGHNPEKLSWVRFPVNMLDLGVIFSVIFNDTYRIFRHMVKLSGNASICRISPQ